MRLLKQNGNEPLQKWLAHIEKGHCRRYQMHCLIRDMSRYQEPRASGLHLRMSIQIWNGCASLLVTTMRHARARGSARPAFGLALLR